MGPVERCMRDSGIDRRACRRCLDLWLHAHPKGTGPDGERHYVSHACRHFLMHQGVLGVMVKIMLAHDPEGKMGAKMPLPDNVIIHEPKEDIVQMGAPPEDENPGYAGDA